MRFQEHYESPKFRGNAFSTEEFMDWYAKKLGNFTYFEDWTGFNIPSHVLDAFYKGAFDPLTKKEAAFLDIFKNIRTPFYVIGTTKKKNTQNADDALKHEIVHGLFYVYPNYRKDVEKCIRSFDTAKLKGALKRTEGYHKAVVPDEMNSYVLTGLRGLVGISEKNVRSLKKALAEVFKKHFGYSIIRISPVILARKVSSIDFKIS